MARATRHIHGHGYAHRWVWDCVYGTACTGLCRHEYGSCARPATGGPRRFQPSSMSARMYLICAAVSLCVSSAVSLAVSSCVCSCVCPHVCSLRVCSTPHACTGRAPPPAHRDLKPLNVLIASNPDHPANRQSQPSQPQPQWLGQGTGTGRRPTGGGSSSSVSSSLARPLQGPGHLHHAAGQDVEAGGRLLSEGGGGTGLFPPGARWGVLPEGLGFGLGLGLARVACGLASPATHPCSSSPARCQHARVLALLCGLVAGGGPGCCSPGGCSPGLGLARLGT